MTIRHVRTWGWILALALVGASCGSSVEPVAPAPSFSTAPVIVQEAPAAPAPPELDWQYVTIGRGGTLDVALKRLGLDGPDRMRILELLAPHVDPRKLSPSTGLGVGRRADGGLSAMVCRPEPDRYYRVQLGDEDGRNWTVEPIDVPVERIIHRMGGVIESTVTAALAGAPESHALILAFADVFQWDVDLFIDPREDDRVRIVYETRHIAEECPELPPFGKAARRPGEFLGLGRILAASYDGAMADAEAYWVAQDGRDGDYYGPDGRSLRKTFLKSPLNYRRISSGFTNRRRHPVTRKIVPHHGVDFAAASGTPVVAAADGRVISTGWQGALGKAVRIRHGNGYTTVYGHLRGMAKGIRSGAEVEQNQVIGYVGSTGRATGPHLHYTMQVHGRSINPLRFENPSAEPLDPTHYPALEQAKRDWRPVLRAIEFDAGTVVRGPASPESERAG